MNSLKAFARGFARQKMVGILSVGSLAVAIGVTVLVGIWAINEFSFDRFSEDREQIYRASPKFVVNGGEFESVTTYKPLGEMMKQRFPEVTSMCRVVAFPQDVKVGDEIFADVEVYMADSNFFSFFGYELEVGDLQDCLKNPKGVVIDRSAAERFFPGENAVGKYLTDGIYHEECQVVGIMPDMPGNSHLRPQVVAPFLGYLRNRAGWDGTDCFMTYFKVSERAVIPKLEKAMVDVVYEGNVSLREIPLSFVLTPLKSLHFMSLGNSGTVAGGKMYVSGIIVLALAVLLIACVNFVNLFAATSFMRAKSIGVKKTLGEERRWLMKEFYVETFYYVVVASIAGVLLAGVTLPLFNELMDCSLQIDFKGLSLYLLLGGIVGFVWLAAGTFPAWYMTKFPAADVLKGQFKGKKLSVLQRGLVVMQFTVSAVLLVSVFFIQKQVHFMVHKELGFDKEHVIYVSDPGDGFSNRFEAFRAEMMRFPVFTDVAMKSGDITYTTMLQYVKREKGDQGMLMEFCDVSPNYFKMLGMPLVAGQLPGEEEGSRSPYCWVNETAAKLLGGANDLVGKSIVIHLFEEEPVIVKGIVKDVQTKPLYEQVGPQVYLPVKRRRIGDAHSIFFKLKGDPQEAIRLIGEKWKVYNPGYLMRYHFLDEVYARMYEQEQRLSRILSAVMAVAGAITVAGLFAMAYYVTQRRMKEMGLRKINGAGTGDLLLLLNREFLVWVGVSLTVAFPLAFWLVGRWLEGFAERTAVSWWVFAGVALIMGAVALVTVSYITWKAARVNPVEVLKGE